LWQQGWKEKDIATALGVSKGAVSQWLTRAKVEGREGLRRHVASGPQPKLVTVQLEQLPQLLNQGAEAFGSGATVAFLPLLSCVFLPGGKFLSDGRRISTSAALLIPRRSFIFMTMLMALL